MNFKPAFTCLFTVLWIFPLSPAYSRTVTIYRTIVASATSEEQARSMQKPGMDVVSYRDSFAVVDGWYDRFEDAMPSDADEAWNQRWRHVYPVDVEVKEARTKGLSIPDLMSETERGLARVRSAA